MKTKLSLKVKSEILLLLSNLWPPQTMSDNWHDTYIWCKIDLILGVLFSLTWTQQMKNLNKHCVIFHGKSLPLISSLTYTKYRHTFSGTHLFPSQNINIPVSNVRLHDELSYIPFHYWIYTLLPFHNYTSNVTV